MLLRYSSLASFLLFVGFLLLGMPIGGDIPSPVRLGGQIVPANSKDSTSIAIVWSAIYLCCGLLALRRTRLALGVLKANAPIVGLLLWLSVGVIWSVDVIDAALIAIQISGSLAFALMAALYFRGNSFAYVRIVSAAIFVSVLINVAVVVLMPGSSIDGDGRWAGVTGNSNYLASIAAVGMLFALIRSRFASRFSERVLSVAMLACEAIVLFNTGSATALIAFFGAAALLLYESSVHESRLDRTAATATAVVAAIGVALAASLVYLSGNFGMLMGLLGKELTFSGRTAIWMGAADAFMKSPAIGYGVAADSLSLDILMRATSFHNGFIEVAIKGGLIGLGFLFVWLLRAFRRPAAGESDEERLIAIILPSVFALTVIHNFGESSLLMARSPVWVMLTSTVLLASAGSMRDAGRGAHSRAGRQRWRFRVGVQSSSDRSRTAESETEAVTSRLRR